MFDLVYTDAAHKDVGVIKAYSLDAAWGADENDFEIVLPSSMHVDFGAFVYIDGTQLGGVIDDKSPDGKGDVATVKYHGRTWHGVMAGSVLCPDAGADYLTYSGDANDVIRTIIARQGLGDVFTCSGASGITVLGRFDRYDDMYGGLMKMLVRDSDVRGRLSIYKEPGGKVHVEAVRAEAYTSEIDSDRYRFKSKIDSRPVNHLVCLGEGDLKERDVVHLYADANGNVSTTRTFSGIDERAETYDCNNVEHDELVSKGIERLEEMQETSGVEMDLVQDEGTFQVGDVVGALDNLTGLYVESTVNKVVVSVGEDGVAVYSYDVGDVKTAKGSSSGGGVSMATLQADFVKKSGDAMSGVLTVNAGDNANSDIVAENNAGRIILASSRVADNFRGIYGTNADGSIDGWLWYVKQDGGMQFNAPSVSVSNPTAWRSALNCGWARISGLSSNMTLSTTATRIPYGTLNYFNTNLVTFSKNGEGIKVSNGCNVGIQAAMYVYTGYTASDLIHIAIYRNTDRLLDIPFRVPIANPYVTISTPIMYTTLSANDTIYAVAWNQTASRGTIANSSYVGLHMWVI